MYGTLGEGWTGCLVIVACALIAVGAFLAWLMPILWAWVKPFIHAVTA